MSKHLPALKISAPAKLNLFLEVVGRRSDGYHLLKSVFAKIDLADELELSCRTDGGVRLRLEGPFSKGLPSGSRNLAVRAAEAFLARFRIGRGVDIRLIKKIPPGSGLGGGSSDAASVLLGLGRIFFPGRGRALRPALRSLGKKLGADVCFFLTPWTVARASGAGEKLSPLVLKKDLPYVVLVYPGVESSTSLAYERLSLPVPALPHRLTTLRHLGKLEKSWKQGLPLSRWQSLLFNRLEESVLPFVPPTARVREFLADQGLRGVVMSGSGSSVFGFCAGRSRAERVCLQAGKKGWGAWVTRVAGVMAEYQSELHNAPPRQQEQK